MSINKVKAKEGASTRIARPIFVLYRNAQLILRSSNKKAFSIDQERKEGKDSTRERRKESGEEKEVEIDKKERKDCEKKWRGSGRKEKIERG